MKINSNYINENFNNSRQNSKTTKQDENSLWDVSFKTLLKEVEEFVESKMKKYKEELVLNKKTGEYEKKKVLDEEAYKEHLRLKLEEQTKEKISTQINEKMEQKLNSNLEKQASINNNLNLKTKENISYMQIQAQEKYHAKNSPTVFSKKQEENNKNLFNTFSAPVGSSV
ncbi:MULTISPECIES: hypothetical protein [Campylobacter]|uniref:Uncharacterized protein n=1 Tax=Campylobacter taeniopygiae TaxID=2510188 RepID=A0ABY2TKS0_9BACT|nr:hypothetical protein [Campylobacter taeniopygiae]MBZ7935446.1 hypothetical protein [Campylobacter sp. B0100352/1]TKX33890.1 hypothetical protein CQA75_05185 [Campylobacter taeniopygiae]